VGLCVSFDVLCVCVCVKGGGGGTDLIYQVDLHRIKAIFRGTRALGVHGRRLTTVYEKTHSCLVKALTGGSKLKSNGIAFSPVVLDIA
jgi:hypothetical protein